MKIPWYCMYQSSGLIATAAFFTTISPAPAVVKRGVSDFEGLPASLMNAAWLFGADILNFGLRVNGDDQRTYVGSMRCKNES